MSPILEVLVGIIFIYSLLSILVTQLNTVISQTLRLRAKHLLGAVNEIIHDETLRAKVITHPLIHLVQGRMVLPNEQISADEAKAIVNGAVNAVEWINPKTFTNVLMSVIRVDSDKELFGALLPIVNGMPAGEDRDNLNKLISQIISTGEGIENLTELITGLQDAPYKDALSKALDEITKEISDTGLNTESNIALAAGLQNIKNPYFREAMNTILSTSKSIEEAEGKIEEWFKDAMDRTSSVFRANMRWISLAVGLILAVVLNIDSLYIAKTLWDDPVLRESVATTAQNTDLTAMQNTVDTAQTNANSNGETTTADVSASIAAATQTLDQIQNLRLPIAWSFEDLSKVDKSNSTEAEKLTDNRYLWNYMPGNNPDWLAMLIMKIFGLGITTVAVAQGAPFWFGILRQLSGKSV